MLNNKETSQPAYQQVADKIAQEIEKGELPPSSKILSERELAVKFGISRMTARAAVNKLVQQGLVVRRKRMGVFVARPRFRFDLSSRAGLHEQLLKVGIKPRSELISAKVVMASKLPSEIRKALGLSKNADIYHITRLRLADGEPIALENSYFPGDLFPDLLSHDLRESIYGILEEHYSVKPTGSTQELVIAFLAKEWAEIMGVSTDLPALEIKRKAVTKNGKLFEFAHDIYRGDRLIFSSTTTDKN